MYQLQNSRIKEFLKEHMLDASCYDWKTELDRFMAEMNAVQIGGSGSVKMIPTWIGSLQPLIEPVSVTAIDIGGTNVRSTVVTLDRNGIVSIDRLPAFQTPGVNERIITEEFFSRIVSRLEDHLHTEHIGICFSLATIPLKNGDAVVSAGAKQLNVADLIGKRVGDCFREAAREFGYPFEQRITVVNDTIAAALGGFSDFQNENYSGFAGFIYGTGTNIAYQETDEMMINIESGAYCGFPTGDIDDLYDSTLIDVHRDRFEKMVSGGYQGGLMTCILERACEEGLLSDAFFDRFNMKRRGQTITAKDISGFSNGRNTDSILDYACTDEKDRAVLSGLFDSVCRRSAFLCSVTIAGALLRMKKQTHAPSFITAEGSTYLKQRNFSQYLDTYLLLNTQPLYGLKYEIHHVENSVLKGTAISALLQ